MILKFDKKEFTKSWNKWGLGAWCQTWIRMGLLDPKGLLTFILIGSLIAGVFYWRGITNTQPIMEIDYEKEITVKAPPNYKYLEKLAFHKPPNSNKWDWLNHDSKEIYAKVRLGDIPESDKLKPYGWESKIIGIMGVGISPNDISGESGAGYRYSRLWSLRTEIVVTNKGFYPVSVSYKPNWFFSNTSVNVAWGKAWEDGMNRGLFAINVEF